MEPYIKHRYQGHPLLIDREWLDPAFIHIICEGPNKRITAFKPLHSSISADAYRFEHGERQFFYKYFLHRNWREPIKQVFRGTRAQRALRGHLQLVQHGFQSPSVVAVGRKAPFSFLVTHYLEGYVGLDHWFESEGHITGDENFMAEKRYLIRWLATLIRRLHDQHIFHGDLGWGNILVKKGTQGQWRYAFIDNERTRYGRFQSDRNRIRNLVDLNMTAGTKLSPSDRLRFFKAYMDFPPPLAYPVKNWLKTIERKTDRGLYRKALKKTRIQAAGSKGTGIK